MSHKNTAMASALRKAGVVNADVIDAIAEENAIDQAMTMSPGQIREFMKELELARQALGNAEARNFLLRKEIETLKEAKEKLTQEYNTLFEYYTQMKKAAEANKNAFELLEKTVEGQAKEIAELKTVTGKNSSPKISELDFSPTSVLIGAVAIGAVIGIGYYGHKYIFEE